MSAPKRATLAEIAADFCADRVAEREALRAMLPCTLDREANIDVEFYGADNPDWQRCGRAAFRRMTSDGPHAVDLPQSRWCPNCIANLDRAAVVNRARRRKGGLVRAMVAAWKRDQEG